MLSILLYRQFTSSAADTEPGQLSILKIILVTPHTHTHNVMTECYKTAAALKVAKQTELTHPSTYFPIQYD